MYKRRVISAEALVVPTAEALTSDDLFIQMLREDSKLELDRRWLARNATAPGQPASCWRRALAIHPESQLAQRGLAHLRRRQSSQGA